MKALLTGSNGFLGGHLKRSFVLAGIQTIEYDISAGQDILSHDAFYLACTKHKPDVVIHAAAIADLYESDKNLDKNFKVNVTGTFQIARICSILKIPIIYISTCCVYGNQPDRHLTDERALPRPTEAYAWSKLAGEQVLRCAGDLRGCILRLGTFYGPGMRHTLFNALAVEKALAGETIEVHGDGEQSRRYIHVSDICSLIIKIIRKNEYHENFPVYNVLGDEEISCIDTVKTIDKTVTRANWKMIPQRAGQILKQNIIGELAKVVFDWKPKINYADGMRDYIERRKKQIALEAKAAKDKQAAYQEKCEAE